MKLWQKVFLGTFVLFEFLFNGASFYLIEHNFNGNLKNEIDRGLTEQRVMDSQIQSDWSYIHSLNEQLNIKKDDSRNFIKNNSQKYTRAFDSNKVFLEVLDSNDSLVYNSFKGTIEGKRSELNPPLSGNPVYILREIGSKTYLFVTSGLVLDDTDFKMSYIRDITGVYSDKSAQIHLFYKINIVITLILAVGLYLMIWYLTRSVRSLTKSAQTITRGDYSQRVNVLSNDEIGILAQNFNQMADAVEDKVDELEVLARQRQNFIDYLTHELKTPLTSIIGYADLLRTTKYNEAVYFKALNYIYSEGKRLEILSFKLMDLILVGKEKPKLEMEEIIPLCLVIEEALKPRLEKSDIELVVSVEPHKLMIEKDLFILLCTNLLDNAMKASTGGSRIFFRGYSDSDRFYVFEVEDEGIGIPEQDVPHVFEPFFMVDKTQSRSHHGAGLGLAICSEIVTLHDGKIEITSRLNIGTKVKLFFPISNN